MLRLGCVEYHFKNFTAIFLFFKHSTFILYTVVIDIFVSEC